MAEILIYLTVGFGGLCIFQLAREIHQARAAVGIMEREKAIADEKESFIMITSHYMRTWTTYIRNGIDLIKSSDKTVDTNKELDDLIRQASALSDKVDGLLKLVSEQGIIEEMSGPNVRKAKLCRYCCPFTILPAVALAAACGLLVYLLVNINSISAEATHLYTRLLACSIAAAVLYAVLRSRSQKRANRLDWLRLSAHQRIINQTRSQFIHDSVNIIGEVLESLKMRIQSIKNRDQAKLVVLGYQNLINLISRFQLAIEIESGRISQNKETFMLSDVVAETVAEQKEAAAAKKLQIDISGNDNEIVQSREIVHLVLASLLDNAIKFSDPGSNIGVVYSYEGEESSVTVTDAGPGMTAAQIERLFHPFSRGEAGIVFEHKGVGFSLYLDRLLMKHLGGDVKIQSRLSRGTAVTLIMRSDTSDMEALLGIIGSDTRHEAR